MLSQFLKPLTPQEQAFLITGLLFDETQITALIACSYVEKSELMQSKINRLSQIKKKERIKLLSCYLATLLKNNESENLG
jgi:hypothetical protein